MARANILSLINGMYKHPDNTVRYWAGKVEELAALSDRYREERDSEKLMRRNAEKRLSSIKYREKDDSKKQSEIDSLEKRLEEELQKRNTSEKELARTRRALESKEKKLAKTDEKLEEARVQIRELKKTVTKLSSQIATLKAVSDQANTQLNRKLKENSETSNFSSSHDVTTHSRTSKEELSEEEKVVEEAKKAAENRKPTSSRKKSDRKRGGQPNHPVHKKTFSQYPDIVIEKTVSKAPSGALRFIDENGKPYYAVQETSMALCPQVTETRFYIDSEVGQPSKEEMEKFKVSPFVYSNGVKAFCLYLMIYAGLPYKRLVTTVSELSGHTIQISEGTIASRVRKAGVLAENQDKAKLERMMKEDVLWVDETSIKISGRNHWLHVIASSKDVYFTVTQKRGDKETSPTAILTEMGYTGAVVHDHFGTYRLLTDVIHVECNVHIERYMRNGSVFDHCEVCDRMLEFYEEHRSKRQKMIDEDKNGYSRGEYEEAKRRFIEISREGMKTWEDKLEKAGESAKVMKKYTPPYYPTFRRMLEKPEEYLRFIEDFRFPYGNNLAEQQIGSFKTKMKISKQCVTKEGAEALAVLMALNRTAQKQGKSSLEMLTELLEQN